MTIDPSKVGFDNSGCYRAVHALAKKMCTSQVNYVVATSGAHISVKENQIPRIRICPTSNIRLFKL